MIMERHYELLLLTVPEITEDEIKGLEKHFEELVQKDNGTVSSFEKWGKYRLAYPVKKNSYGVYILIRFKTPKPDVTPEQMKTALAIRFDSLVMRSVITLLGDSMPEYQRPRSLEETPAEEATGGKDFRRDRSSFGSRPRRDGERPPRFGARNAEASISEEQTDAGIDTDDIDADDE